MIVMKIQAGLRRAFLWLTVLVSMSLVGCAGTVKHLGVAPTGIEQRVPGVAKLVLDVDPAVKVRLANTTLFTQAELTRRINDRLARSGLVSVSADQYVDVSVTDVRIRSSFNAIMFGFMAGDDHIAGRVRLMSDAQQELRSFDINASYALGGFAGGQDGARLNWLYEKFSELVLQELEKMVAPVRANASVMSPRPVAGKPASTVAAVLVSPPNVASPALPTVAAPLAPPQAKADLAIQSGQPAPVVANTAPVAFTTSAGSTMVVLPAPSAADRVLENSQVAHRYHIYLSRPNPKAFAVSANGGWWMAWGDASGANDTVSQRALRGCEERSNGRCTLYAIDNRVVYGQSSGEKP